MAEWHLDVGGAAYDVTTAMLANGKIAVRANGRIVAPPQPADRVDCRFALGAAMFHLSGGGESLRLDPVIVVPVTPPAAPPPPTPAPETPLTETQILSYVQLRCVAFIVIGAVLLLVGGCGAVIVGGGITREQARQMSFDEQAASVLTIVGTVRSGCALEAVVGVAMILGGLGLASRHQLGPRLLHIASWASLGAGAYTIVAVDVLLHRHLRSLDVESGRKMLAWFHWRSFVVLVLMAIAAGALIAFLDRRRLAAVLDSA